MQLLRGALSPGKMKKILVLGVGNEICGDDGFGPAVVKAIVSDPAFMNVDLNNGAVGGLGILWIMEDYDIVLLVDAIQGIGSPGEVKRLLWTEIVERPGARQSLHEIELSQAVAFANAADWKVPEMIVFGVEPKSLGYGDVGLSSEASLAIPKVIEMIKKEISSLV